MAINNTIKSSRLLQSKRYTHDSFTDAQEAFTSTLDINAGEIYSDQSLIPSASLPFSGSTQNGSTYSVNGQSVLKYYYRYPMTRSNLVSGSANEVWFLLSPSGSNAGIGAQVIDANQQTNFISPKYSVPALSTATAEDSTPGYGVKVFVSTNATTPAAGDQVSSNNYAFDYKTGVLQFATNALSATTSQYVYITTYQYVGRTVATALQSSGTGFPYTGSAGITGSLFIVGQSSFVSTPSYQTNDFFLVRNTTTTLKLTTNGLQVSSSAQTPLQVFDQNNNSILNVSQSGVITFATQSAPPTGSTNNGAIWITNTEFYVGLT